MTPLILNDAANAAAPSPKRRGDDVAAEDVPMFGDVFALAAETAVKRSLLQGVTGEVADASLPEDTDDVESTIVTNDEAENLVKISTETALLLGATISTVGSATLIKTGMTAELAIKAGSGESFRDANALVAGTSTSSTIQASIEGKLAVETKGSVVAHGGAILPLSGKLATTIGSSSIAASTKNTEQVAPDAPRNDPKWQALPVAPQTVQALATFQPPAVAVAKLVNAAQPEVFETATKSIATESLFGLAASDRTFAATQSVTSAAPTTSAQTARHVAGQIAVANLTGKATEIALNPEELGRVRLTMTAVDGTITLNVLAERLETNDLLRRHIDVLAQEFRDLGYDTISFSFGAEDQPETPTDASPFEDGEQSETDQATETDINLQANPSSGLDLRL